jgi:flagellar motility protein MotE (MotC chaperone)
MCLYWRNSDDGGVSDEVDFVESQLLPQGASDELIGAVRQGDDKAIAEELQQVKDPQKLAVLTRIIQRIGLILGQQR